MQKEPFEKYIFKEVILSYRRVIDERYQYDLLKEKYDLPKSFDEERIALFRSYFLNYLYPNAEKREELNDAFESMDKYIRHPEKLLPMLIDSSMLIFKYGRHLPKILKAGMKAMRSFRKASHFENKLVQNAISAQLKPPYNKVEINNLIRSLSRSEVDDFVESSQSLFETLYDRVLVRKILEIVEYLIGKMKKRPGVYSIEEIRGLEIGHEVIKKGDALFDQLTKEDQRKLFDLAIKIEGDNLDDIFSLT